jgi:hypothetical protein
MDEKENAEIEKYYKAVSNVTLIQVHGRLNRRAFPERFKLLEEEIARRNIRSPDGRFSYKDPNGPKGMGGWLLVFTVMACINNTLMGRELLGEGLLLYSLDLLSLTFVVYLTLGFFVTVLAFVAAFLLASSQKYAVKTTVTFLFIFLLFSLFSSVLGLEAPRHDDHPVIFLKMLDGLTFRFPLAIPYVVVWYNYFKKSVRVANTYES